MIDSPQEASLKAEVAQLRAQNAYLRRAVDAPGRVVASYSVEDSMMVAPGMIRDTLTLRRMAGVEGALQDDHRWSVHAWHERMDGGKLSHAYYIDRASDGFDDDVFANVILPKVHERFIRQLSDIFRRK